VIGRATRYAGPSARVRTLFGDLLRPNDYELLLNEAGIADLTAALSTTAYAAALNIQGKSFAFAIQQHWVARTERVAAVMPSDARELCLAYLAKAEAEALKTALRGIARDVDRRRLVSMLGPLPARSSIPLSVLLAAGSLEEAVGVVSRTPYGAALAEGMKRATAQSGRQLAVSLLPLETSLDHSFFARLLSATRRFTGSEHAIVARLVGVLADATNVLAVQRLRKTFRFTPQAASLHLIPFGFRLGAAQRQALCGWTGEGSPPVRIGSTVSGSELRVAVMRAICGEALKPLFAAPFQAGLAIAYVLLAELEASDLIAIHEGKQWGLERVAIAGRLIRFQAAGGSSGV
jgi:vacuolar-type H+-ATPase subunit C/Vma6